MLFLYILSYFGKQCFRGGQTVDFKKIVRNFFIYNHSPNYQSFTLEETEREDRLSSDGDILDDTVAARTNRGKLKKPKRPQKSKEAKLDGSSNNIKSLDLSSDLEVNKERIERLFHLPYNKDLIIREFAIGSSPALDAFVVFLEGMASKITINEYILEPLMFASFARYVKEEDLLLTCKHALLKHIPSNQVKELSIYQEVAEAVTAGDSVIFIEGAKHAIACETKSFAARTVSKASSEQVVQGPQEGFVEAIRQNTSLVRRIIRSENLITEMMQVGARNKASVAMMYLKDLANPKLVQEIKRRISKIETDYIGDTGMLEEFIEDHPFALVPQTLKTERPDRVAAHLVEGKVAIIIDGSPFALIVPVDFFAFLQSPEDFYLRLPYGFWLRILRMAAIFLTLLLPAFYIAVATFHQEMIPTDLLLSISAAKEMVPFPTVLEILFMELAFELIREAGVRVPGVIGATLGIVGTLILGQSAVSAAIVSPISIIIVAVTGLASFAIPNYSLAFGFRFMRLAFIPKSRKSDSNFWLFSTSSSICLLVISAKCFSSLTLFCIKA
jgi:spore germination protein KA